MKNKKNIKIHTILLSLLILFLVYIIGVGIILYGLGKDNKLIRETANLVPYPGVIFSNGAFISFSEINNKLASIRRFYENQDFSQVGLRVDFSTEEGQKRLKIKEKDLINKLIENRIIQKIANQRGIKVTQEEAEQEVSRKMDEYGTQTETKNNLARLYGWTVKEFEENIVIPDLYKQKLEENVIANEISFVEAKRKIEEAQTALQSGSSFEEVAKKYSDGESAQKGGELGWFGYHEMLPEIASVAYLLDKDKTSDIIESSLGYHIISIEDKKTENEQEMVRLRQIFVRTESFSDWIRKQKENLNIFIPLQGLFWNKSKGEVDFSNESMRNFEEQEIKNSLGEKASS